MHVRIRYVVCNKNVHEKSVRQRKSWRPPDYYQQHSQPISNPQKPLSDDLISVQSVRNLTAHRLLQKPI